MKLNNIIHWIDIDHFPHSEQGGGDRPLDPVMVASKADKCTQAAWNTHHTELGLAGLEEGVQGTGRPLCKGDVGTRACTGEWFWLTRRTPGRGHSRGKDHGRICLMCSMRRQVQLEQRGTGWGGGQDHREACGDDSPVQGQSHEIGAMFGLHRPLQPHLFLPSSPFT